MPGLLGIISKDKVKDHTVTLNRMIRSMMHESFYIYNTYIDRGNGYYIGSIAIKGAFCDCMPIYNEKRNCIMFLSGECFIDEDVKNRLKSQKHDFYSNDASFLIHLYEEKGSEFFSVLNGWFNGIILDIEKKEAILFNDRFGMQRIYVHETCDAWYFSSEAKALLKIFPALRRINPVSMGEYFNYDCVLNNKTFFSDIFLLPGGSKWTFSRDDIIKQTYFSPADWENQPVMEKDFFYSELSNTFQRILSRYFVGGHMGIAMTGGLDTRMILSCINPEPEQLDCFTFGGMYRDSLDVRIARKVAESYGLSHRTIRLDSHYLNNFYDFVTKAIYMSDGLSNVTTADEFYLNSQVREITQIKMTGKFGSQVMRSLAGLRDRCAEEKLYQGDFKKYLDQATETFTSVKRKNNMSFFLFNEIPWYWSSFTAAEQSQLTVRSPFLDNELVALLYRAPENILDGPEFQMDLIRKTNPDLMKIRTNQGLGGQSNFLVSSLIRYWYKILGISDKVYSWDRIPYSMTHTIAKMDQHLLRPLHIDGCIRGNEFFRHYRTWFRDELSSFVQEVILDSRTKNRPYWDERFLEKIVSDHINGKANYMLELRKILTVELIHRQLIEGLN